MSRDGKKERTYENVGSLPPPLPEKRPPVPPRNPRRQPPPRPAPRPPPNNEYVDMSLPLRNRKKPELNLRESDFDCDYLTPNPDRPKLPPKRSKMRPLHESDYLECIDPPKPAEEDGYLVPNEPPRVDRVRRFGTVNIKDRPLPEIPREARRVAPETGAVPRTPLMHTYIEIDGEGDDDDDGMVMVNYRTPVYHKREERPVGRKSSIQDIPLPPIPGEGGVERRLPRPPTTIPQLSELSFENLTIFNTQQDFNDRYSNHRFYRCIDRRESERLLLRPNVPNGSYILRPSKKFYCTVSIKYGEMVYQLAVNRIGRKLFQAGMAFDTVDELIEFFKEHPMHLYYGNRPVDLYLMDALPDDVR